MELALEFAVVEGAGVGSLVGGPMGGAKVLRFAGLVGVLGVSVFLAFSRSALAFNRLIPWSKVRHLSESSLTVYRVE